MVALVTALSPWPVTARPDSPEQTAIELSLASRARTADLIRLWAFARMFHHNEQAFSEDWDRALENVAEAALLAPDDIVLAELAE